MSESQRAGKKQSATTSGGESGEPDTSNPAHIPVPLTSLIGRESDVAEVANILTSGQVRLLTLTGPGGVGKTRLALQVAASVQRHFSGGVYFVPLASVGNPSLVLPTIAQTLGIDEAAGQPVLNRLCAALRDRHLLLILDNFEQVLAAGQSVLDLLLCVPTLNVLVTSRAVLKVYGEQEYPVSTLTLPDASKEESLAQLTQYEAVRLFIERARASKRGFTVNNSTAPAVAEICYRLDGLPLAIELAASRIKILSPQTLLKRLDKRLPLLTGGPVSSPYRHQTLRNAIAWSYDLLSEEEQRLFRCLSVFVGGYTLEAVEAIYIVDDPETKEGTRQADNSEESSRSLHSTSLLDLLTALIDKSLLQHEEQEGGAARFSMLQTIREYACECLAESGEEPAVEQRHTDYFLRLAEKAGAEISAGYNQPVLLDMLAAEHDNMRAVLNRAASSRDAETGLQLGAALFQLWYIRGYLTEGRKWLSDALEYAGDVPATIRANALKVLGNLAGTQSEYEVARKCHEQVLTLSEEAGDKIGMATALGNLANSARLQGHYDRSLALCERSLAIYKSMGQERPMANVLYIMSVVTWEQGNYEKAREICEDTLVRRRAMGDKAGIATSLNTLGMMVERAGNLEQARVYYEECLSLCRELGDGASEARTLQALGEAIAQEGDYQAALELQSRSLRTRYQFGTKRGILNSLQGMAVVAGEHSEPRRLIRLIAAAEAIRAAIGAPDNPQENARYEKWLDLARTKLGPAAASAAWDEGKSLALEEAVALALDGPISESVEVSSNPPVTRPTRPGSNLTAREVEVLRLLTAGLTSHAIAAHLQVTINTVQSHLKTIFSKINVNTRVAAVRYAFEHNLS